MPVWTTKSKARQVLVHIVDAEIAADFIEIDIAGLRDCVMQVDGPVTLRFPVAVAMVVALQLKVADANSSFESDWWRRFPERPATSIGLIVEPGG